MIGGDRFGLHIGECEDEGGDEAGAVTPTLAIHDGWAIGDGERRDGTRKLGTARRQKREVAVSQRRPFVRGVCTIPRQEGHADNGDRDRPGRIVDELVVFA